MIIASYFISILPLLFLVRVSQGSDKGLGQAHLLDISVIPIFITHVGFKSAVTVFVIMSLIGLIGVPIIFIAIFAKIFGGDARDDLVGDQIGLLVVVRFFIFRRVDPILVFRLRDFTGDSIESTRRFFGTIGLQYLIVIELRKMFQKWTKGLYSGHFVAINLL